MRAAVNEACSVRALILTPCNARSIEDLDDIEILHGLEILVSGW